MSQAASLSAAELDAADPLRDLRGEFELPDGIYFDLRMEDKAIELQTDDDDDSDIDISPQVLLLASGEATPFNLYVESDDTDIAYELVVDVLGDSELLEHDRGF